MIDGAEDHDTIEQVTKNIALNELICVLNVGS